MIWGLIYFGGAVFIATSRLTELYARYAHPAHRDLGAAIVFSLFWPLALPLAIASGLAKAFGARQRRRLERARREAQGANDA